jgi:uncharacterized protein YbjT (DUF2867 family)
LRFDPGIETMNVAISGSTGLVGSALLQLLCNEVKVTHIYAVGRREPELAHAKITFIQSSLDTPAKNPAIDAAFCCLGTTIKKAGSEAAFRAVDHDMVLSFARASKSAGACQFILVSALGAHAKSRVFYNRVKGETEDALAAMQFESLSVLRPSFLTGDRAESRPGERLGIAVFSALSPLMRGTARRYRPVAAADVAACMWRAAAQCLPGVQVIESERIAR